ncbi:MAG: DNA double-strand break repair nuclease NurA [Thermoplasmata archaeon]|nr:DNA double-strand break repair nuclease NurA [Thermoplasmata archaeon]
MTTYKYAVKDHHSCGIYLELNNLSQGVIIQEGFFDFLDKIKNGSKIPDKPDPYVPEIVTDNYGASHKIALLEKNEVYDLDVQNGCASANKESIIAAYDEAINRYSALEGKVAYVSHSLVYLYEGNYYPTNKLTLLFATKSEDIANNNDKIIFAGQWDVETHLNVEISKQKREFIAEFIQNDSLLLIDGPFLAGDGMAVFKGIIKECFLDRGVISVFVVKNSYSSLVTDCIPELKGKYNSDLHWSNTILKPGQRTRFYKYTDQKSSDNSKVFCYLKFREGSSPIRIEIPTPVFEANVRKINTVMDMIYYFILVQGNYKNPQARPIAIAEMFARETLNLINFNKEMKVSHLTSTMNQERGMDFND